YETAQALRRLLNDHALLNDGRHQIAPQYAFFASDTVEKFNAFANSILPYEISSTTKVQIEQY
ncbi:MAG: glutamate racemase, partial [Eubacterium sp.]|nr:glutamate racemase [Eubacterium sp.]